MGDQMVAFSNGQVEIALPAGQTQVSFALLNTGDVDSTMAYTLNASLIQANPSANTQPASADFQINLQGVDESTFDIKPTNLIFGDFASLTDVNGSIQYDSWGNVVTDPGQPEPSRADILYRRKGGNDVVFLGDGDDILLGGQGSAGRAIHPPVRAVTQLSSLLIN
ncbi:MAG: hypothetical protein ACYC3N_08455 [Halothiobacillus sp.]